MKWFDGWRRYQAERAAHKQTKQAYDSLGIAYRRAITALNDLGERVQDLEHHIELMTCDNADLERTLDAMREGLQWFDPEAKR